MECIGPCRDHKEEISKYRWKLDCSGIIPEYESQKKKYYLLPMHLKIDPFYPGVLIWNLTRRQEI